MVLDDDTDRLRREMETGWAQVTNITQSATVPNVYTKSVAHIKGDPGYLVTACTLHGIVHTRPAMY